MKILLKLILYCLITQVSWAQLDSLTISSAAFTRNIKIYLYDSDPLANKEFIVYIPDGKKLMDQGMINRITELTESNAIASAYYVLVSTIDPDSNADYRNEYFFCNAQYHQFFVEELIPKVENKLNQIFTEKERNYVGISFGALNGMYFLTQKPQVFGAYGLLSPITYPCPNIANQLALTNNETLKVVISSGRFDAEHYVGKLLPILKSKQYNLKSIQTKGGHDFDNWNAQWKEVFQFLFSN